MSDSVLYEVLEEVAYITLNRPDKLNAMDDDLLAGVAQALAQASADTQAKVGAAQFQGSPRAREMRGNTTAPQPSW